MHADGIEDLVGNHGEVLLVAVDLDGVHLLEDAMLSVFGVELVWKTPLLGC